MLFGARRRALVAVRPGVHAALHTQRHRCLSDSEVKLKLNGDGHG